MGVMAGFDSPLSSGFLFFNIKNTNNETVNMEQRI